jgi:hypothetical protein
MKLFSILVNNKLIPLFIVPTKPPTHLLDTGISRSVPATSPSWISAKYISHC